ncbi:hypothetical protein Patl1_01484 [Pistacia atlantica]|uniref:Uncharacterized protein n=1 Tax=Pistacia atlantica TaxID=434234 RepID=A0ACC1C7A4_9ROSI|nr:hypothetical protein Patl1_01484 [Pistacia atlantica]
MAPRYIGPYEILQCIGKPILDHCTYKRQLTQVLVHWHGLSPVEATWENVKVMKLQFPDLGLEDKTTIKEGGRCYMFSCGSEPCIPCEAKS